MKLLGKLLLLVSVPLIAACSGGQEQCRTRSEAPDWQTVLAEQMPLLGHRNWIVVTDMAYPLQTNPGITTLFADAPYADVIRKVSSLINDAPHVFAHIYQDSEQQKLSEELVPGWDAYKASVAEVLKAEDVEYVPHEELIRRLDEVSSLCRVVIIKTPLTLPYTSTLLQPRLRLLGRRPRGENSGNNGERSQETHIFFVVAS